MNWKKQDGKKTGRGLSIFLLVLLMGTGAMYKSGAEEPMKDILVLEETESQSVENTEKVSEETDQTEWNKMESEKTEIKSESEKVIETEQELYTEQLETMTEEMTETEAITESEMQSEEQKEQLYETQYESETEENSESEEIPITETELQLESEKQTETENESETETKQEQEIPFEVILLTENRYARAAGQATVDTFGQLEILGARTAYKHHKETFQTIYCLNYIRNGAYGIYGSDRILPVHPSITYVLAKGMKMAKNNETIDPQYRGNNDQESYYITQMALHLVNGAIGGEEDISAYLDSSKNPSVYQKIYALYQDAMNQKEPIVDKEGYTKEVTCKILPEIQNTWIKDEKNGGFRTKEDYKIVISDISRVSKDNLSIVDSPSSGLSIINQGNENFYLHAEEEAFEKLKTEKNLKIQIVWSGQVQEKTGYRYIHLSGEWPGITDYQDLIFLEDAAQPVTLQQTVSAMIENVPAKKGRITVVKKDQETKEGLKGAVFGIYEERTCKTLVVKTEESNEEGKAQTPEFELKETGSYFLKEIKAPLYHLLDETVTEIPVTDLKNNKEIVYTMEDAAQKGKIILQKEDKDQKEPRIEGTLQGAIYLVFAKETIYKSDLKTVAYEAYKQGDNENAKSFVASLTTDENGRAQTENLYPGKYLLFEKVPSEGYLKEETIHEAEVFPENNSILNFSVQITSKEEKIRGDLELKKTGKKADQKIPLQGAEFTVTSKKTGDIVAVLVTDENGHATTKKEDKKGSLLYGTYVVTETKAPEGYEKAESFEVKVDQEGYLYQYEVENEQKRGRIQIQKVDAETKQAILFSGAEFQIVEKESGQIVAEGLTTDETGTITVEESIPFGIYILEELTPPAGYQKGEKIEFCINQEEMITIVCENEPVKGKIKIIKRETGTEKGLSDVSFSIIAKEEIITRDGNIRLKEGEIADTVTTDQDGIGVSRELYPGLYEIREERQKAGYSKNTERKEIRILEEKETVQEIVMENIPTRMRIQKKEEGSDNVLAGTVFFIWREGEKKEEYITDEKGEIVREQLIPGTYYVEEKQAKEGYLKSEQRYSFVVDQDGKINGKEEVILQVSNTKMEPKIKVAKLANKTTGVILEEGRYQGTKTSGTYTASELVEYKILVTNSGNVTAKKIEVFDEMQEELRKQIVPESAEFAIESGTYETILGRNTEVTKVSETQLCIAELIPGDALEVKFRVKLKEDATRSEELENIVRVTGEYESNPGESIKIPEDEDDWDFDRIRIENVIQVEIWKVDASTEKPLSGAKLAVLDQNGKVIEEWISQEEAHKVKGVEIRKVYTLKEIEAPKGYQRAENITFTVLDTPKMQTIIMKDEPEPQTILPTSQSTTENDIVKTGDQTEITKYIGGALMSLCMVSMILIRKSRKDNKR